MDLLKMHFVLLSFGLTTGYFEKFLSEIYIFAILNQKIQWFQAIIFIFIPSSYLSFSHQNMRKFIFVTFYF